MSSSSPLSKRESTWKRVETKQSSTDAKAHICHGASVNALHLDSDAHIYHPDNGRMSIVRAGPNRWRKRMHTVIVPHGTRAVLEHLTDPSSGVEER